ncbi:MAG TPA: hypothetical protein VFV31_12285 [Chitinophagaceae bacterium]|nr:hypothetical protein [Chitinophagaceae bacterium]
MKTFLSFMLLLVILLTACTGKKGKEANPVASPENKSTAFVLDTSLSSYWTVKGCAEAATRNNTKFPSSGEYKDYPELPPAGEMGVKAAADSIIYNRFEQHLCCRQVKVAIEKKDKTITFTEYWFGHGCKCRCSSTVHAVVRELPKGEYQVYGIATGTDPVEDKPTGLKDTVLQEKVIIR